MMLTLIIMGVFLLASAAFSGFENGMIGIRRARLDHAVAQGSGAALLIRRFLDKPGAMLGTVLLGTNLANSLWATYGDELSKQFPAGVPGWVISVVWPAWLALLVLVFGEILPKAWFRQRPYARCSMLIYPMVAMQWVCYPAVRAIETVSLWISGLVVRTEPGGEATGARLREDFRIMLLESQEAGLIDAEAGMLLDRALEFRHKRVGDLMTPLEAVETVSTTMTVAEAMAVADDTELSRFPVTRARETRRWVGMFSVYDVLFNLPRDRWGVEMVVDHMRPVASIGDGAAIPAVLAKVRATRRPLLAVMNAERQPCGVVSVSDVVAPLFGDVQM